MGKFFVPGSFITGDIVKINGSDAKHLTKVLRKNVNDDIILCDGCGYDYTAVILSAEDDVSVKITGKQENRAEPKIHVTIYQALPKGDKMEGIVKKCTELGVFSVVPFISSRVVVKADGAKLAQKVSKWQKTADESVKQCMRGAIPKIHPVITFNEAAALACKHKSAIMAYELCEEGSLRGALQHASAGDIGVVIGPEGGFEPEEAALARDSGINIVTLGKRILRVETAAAAVLSIIMYHFNEI